MIVSKRKTKCNHCGRRMVVVYEMHEACSNPVCDYTYSYAFDIPEGMEEEFELVFGDQTAGDTTTIRETDHG